MPAPDTMPGTSRFGTEAQRFGRNMLPGLVPGAAVGGAMGLGNHLIDLMYKDKEDRRGLLKSILLGSLLGGGVGGGISGLAGMR